MLKKIIIFAFIFVLLAIPIINFAITDTSTYKEKKEEAEDAKQSVEEEKSALMKSIQELSNSISDNEDELVQINAELNQLKKEIEKAEDKIREAQEKYNEQEEALKEKLIMGYEIGSTTYLDVLLNSKGVLDFLSNYYIISEILENDNDILDSIEEQKNKIEKNKQELEDKQKEAKTKKAKQEAINVTLTNQKTQKENKVNQLSKEEKEYQSQIDEYDRLIRQAEAEARSIASGSTGSYVGGNKVWPCSGYYNITSGFGNRNTGIPGATTNHKAIDIGCPIGTAILSTLSGKVIAEKYNSARGYYIMVDHGGRSSNLIPTFKS